MIPQCIKNDWSDFASALKDVFGEYGAQPVWYGVLKYMLALFVLEEFLRFTIGGALKGTYWPFF